MLNNYGIKTYINVIIIVFIIIFLLIKLVLYILSISYQSYNIAIANQISYTIIGTTVALTCINKWGWKIRCLNRWFPNLQGTWRGNYRSTSLREDTTRECMLVIRQTFTNIYCTLFTEESTSISFTSSIKLDHEQGRKELTYSYINEPNGTVQFRSKRHKGTAFLRIISNKKENELIGSYWTDRLTKGDLELKFLGRELYEKFVPKSLTEVLRENLSSPFKDLLK